MATDTVAMSLLIRLMPLMQREFALRVDPAIFFTDEGYREAVLNSALEASEPRLRGYAAQLRQRLVAIGFGSPGALRSTANWAASHAARSDFDRTTFDRTTPGALGDFVTPAHPATAAAPAAAASADTGQAGPATPAAPTSPDDPPPAPGPARRYIGRLR
jgi:hypothetical protein